MSIHLSSGRKAALCLVPLLLAGSAWAQQKACLEIKGGTVKDFRIERRVPLAAFSSTNTPEIPPALLASLTSGALEVRERLFYNPDNNRLTITWFTQAPAATFPTPIPVNLTQSTIQVFAINVAQIIATQKPGNNALFAGEIATGGAPGPFGDLSGAPATVSAAFTEPDAAGAVSISNVLLNVAGVFSSYTAAASGQLDITYPTDGGGGGGGNGEGPTADAGTGGTVADYSVVLDGTKSTGKAPLTYSWAMAAGSKTAAISGGDTATPTVSFGEGFGEYTFELTVTDADSKTGKDTVTFSYTGR